MIEFKKYEGANSTLEDLGTVKELAGKKGKIALIRKNFNNPEKRVVVVLTNAKDESAVISCSKQVSDALRKKEMTIAQLVGLNVVQNEEGVAFISMPATGGLQEFSLDTVKTAPVEHVAEFLPAELVAF